jgi:SAM-dependent methyltransferase
MDNTDILITNKNYWDNMADSWFGTTALPVYGVQFITEKDLNLFGDVKGKKLLEIGCGSGHSLKYHAENGAAELWGLDMSTSQIQNASKLLSECGYAARLINESMEKECHIPKNYFDFVYSIYAIGWTIDLQGTFDRIASYLKKDGIFIFSWKHPLHHCVTSEENKLVFQKSYFDESWFDLSLDGFEIKLCNRKISTYINALAKAGFLIEEMSEQTDRGTMEAADDLSERSIKARQLPLSFVIKARKL